MFTANVGHGQAVAACGNACARAARASVPSAPPAKMAATVRQSARGSTSRPRPGRGGGGAASASGGPAASPGTEAALEAAGSGTRNDSSGT